MNGSYRRAAATPRLPASEQSEAERYDKALGSIKPLSCRSAAGRRSPALLWMSGHRLRSVRSSPHLGEVRVYAELSLSLNKKMRGEDRTAYGTERSGRSASERMFAECAEPSGAKWRSRGDGAEPPYAKRCALRRAPGRSARLSGAGLFAPAQYMRFACAVTNYHGAGKPPIWSVGVRFSERSPASAMMIDAPRRGIKFF